MHLTLAHSFAISAFIISPASTMVIFFVGVPLYVPSFSIEWITFSPSRTVPKTTFFLSNHETLTVLMKNCYPLVSLLP